MQLKVAKRLVRWGHGYGIRLSRHEVEDELRTKAGGKVRATLEPDTSEKNDLSSLIVFPRTAGRHRKIDIDRIMEEELE